MHGPFATQPAQQNGNPTWNVAGPTISTSQVTQVKGRVVLRRRSMECLGLEAHPGSLLIHRGAPIGVAGCHVAQSAPAG